MNERELAAAGRKAAQVLWREGVKADVDDPLRPAFAKAAVDEFARLQSEQTPGIYRDVLAGASRGAEHLDLDPFHGVIEVLQNADDAGARELRVGLVGSGGTRRLCFVHNGKPADLRDLVAMSLSFVSTKLDEAFQKGRFGIGLKTLRSLGGMLNVHSGPYHVSISLTSHQIARIEPARRHLALAVGGSPDTLLELEVDRQFDAGSFQAWFKGLDVTSLLFLDSVRRLELIGSRSAAPIASFFLKASERREFLLKAGRQEAQCEEMRLAGEDGRAWRRYLVQRPVPKSAPSRSHKKSGKTTPLEVAIPEHEGEEGRLFAGLPLATPVTLPFSVNAQFDVDTPRTGIPPGPWNTWLFARLAEALAGIARHRFERAPASGWASIPLVSEVDDVPVGWLRDELTAVVEKVQRRVFTGLRFSAEGREVPLRELLYEARELERLLTPAELALLAFDGAALPKRDRDKGGRWREVVGELGVGTEIEIVDALRLLELDDEALGKSVGWFIRLAQIAIAGGEASQLLNSLSIVLRDGTRVVPPAPNYEGEVLVRRIKKSSLASQLGLARVIHPSYLTRGPEAVQVAHWLTEAGILVDDADDSEALRALARRGEVEDPPIPLSDRQLIKLRGALMGLGEEERAELGPWIGAAVTVEGFSWRGRRKARRQVPPTAAYLPKTLEDRREAGWTTAAGTTPGIAYVAARYANVLKVKRGKEPLPGAARLFRMLGAEVAPFLIEPETAKEVYGDPANPLAYERLSRSQIEALDGRYASHSKGDRRSDDLERVINDIAKDRSRKRRSLRSRALLLTLEREWGRLYADRLEARALISDRGWIQRAVMPATWLAIARDVAWLNDLNGKPRPPRELVVRTLAMEALHGSEYEHYAADLDEGLARSQVVRALGIVTDARVSQVVDQLAEMRRQQDAPALAPLATRYLALDAAVKRVDVDPDDVVGDLSVRQLRIRFGAHPKRPGLIFAAGAWRRPREVFLGAPIFGDRRPFVPEPKRAERLWRLLHIPSPGLEPCLEVLAEIAAAGAPSPADEEVLCNVYAHLENLVPELAPRSAQKVAGMPLWTGKEWASRRPLYAVEDEFLATQLAEKIPLWRAPLSLGTVPRLLDALGVELLEDDRFEPLVDEADLNAGTPYRETASEAVAGMRDDLTRNDRDLYRRLAIPWDDLMDLEVALPRLMALRLKLPGKRPFAIATRAHLSRSPLRLACAGSGEIGQRAAGGRAIASLFPPADRHKASMSWAAAWSEVETEQPRRRVALAEGRAETSVEDLYRQANEAPVAPSRRRRKKGEPEQGEAPPVAPPTPAVRRLKSAEELEVSVIERPLGSTGRRRRPRSDDLREPEGGRAVDSLSPARRSAPQAYSSEDQQHLALLALNQAINGELADLEDFQHLRGIGADAVDRLKRYFEIKSTAGSMKDQITMTPNEFQRAVEKGESFYLAIVSGLEVGYETIVRIIPNPVRTLDVRRSQGLVLSGILSVDKPIEIRFAPETES